MPEIDKKTIKKTYLEHKEEISSRIKEFKQLRNADEERLFRELAFVILSSRNSAREAWNAALKLDRDNLLGGDEEKILEVLRKYDISFEVRKAGFIVRNFEQLSQPSLEDPSGDLKVSSRIDPERIQKTRENMVEWPGLGWKGASHFLRNTGYGDDLGIVSSHISKALHDMEKIDSPEPPNSRKEYLEAEQKLREISGRLEIDLEALDLAIWASRTGEVFR